jgi:hypothetical protein
MPQRALGHRRMQNALIATLACLLVFHSPDGSEILVEKAAIKVIKPIDTKHHDHIAAGTGSIVYTGVRPNGFGIMETTRDVVSMIKATCEP